MPIVHVEAIKPNLKKGKNSLLASAQETAKYQVKSKDILTDNQERDLRVVEDLEQGLAGSRMLGFGGLLRDIRKELQLDADEENENLIDTSGDDEEIGDKVREVVAKWNFERQNYFV
ncbi:protein rep [Loigolactobacillus coryniformis]|nr:protein rep [Loigolactobacillus coryniformis]